VRDAIFSVGARNESRVLSLMFALPVNAGTPASPMRMLSRCSEHPLNVPIDSPHHADARALASWSRPSAAPIRQPIAICHSSISRSAIGRLVMRTPASRRVTCSRPPGGRIRSSRGGPRWQRAWIVRSVICLQGCAACSIGVLFRRFDCRTLRADCCASLSRSRSSFNSEI